MQTTFSREGALGFAGEFYGSDTGRQVKPMIATENTGFGVRLSYDDAANKSTGSPVGTNKATLTNSGNLGASNVYSFTIKFTNLSTGNETSYDITETYASSDASTMGAVVTQLEALDEIDDTGTAYSSNVLTIVPATGYIMEVSAEAVNGGSAVTIAKVNFDTRERAGFSLRKDQEYFYDSTGTLVAKHKANSRPMGNALAGALIVDSPTGFDGEDTLYIIGYGPNRAKVANAAGDNGIAVTDIKHLVTASGANSRGVVTFDLT